MDITFQGSYTQSVGYAIDVVFCIDATKSMQDSTNPQLGIMSMVKELAANLYFNLSNTLVATGRSLQQFRARVITFRDYVADSERAMMVSDFFRFPHQASAFEECIHSICADGGGDAPEDGLEALAYAIRSKWATESPRKRQVIIVCTDAGAHDLGFGKKSPHYPKGMPTDLNELHSWWENPSFINQIGKRLILLAPDVDNWKSISDHWYLTIHCPSALSNGLTDADWSLIVCSVLFS